MDSALPAPDWDLVTSSGDMIGSFLSGLIVRLRKKRKTRKKKENALRRRHNCLSTAHPVLSRRELSVIKPAFDLRRSNGYSSDNSRCFNCLIDQNGSSLTSG